MKGDHVANQPIEPAAMASPRQHPVGQPPDLPLAVNTNHQRLTSSNDLPVTNQFVGMADAGGGDLLDPSPQEQEVVIFGSRLVAATSLSHHHEQAGILKGPVSAALGPQHLSPAHLEISEVVPVMDPSLAVSLLIADPDLHLVDKQRGTDWV